MTYCVATPPNWLVPRSASQSARRPCAGCSITTCTPRMRPPCCSTRGKFGGPLSRCHPRLRWLPSGSWIKQQPWRGLRPSTRCCSRSPGRLPHLDATPAPGSSPGQSGLTSQVADTGTTWPHSSASRWNTRASTMTGRARLMRGSAGPDGVRAGRGRVRRGGARRGGRAVRRAGTVPRDDRPAGSRAARLTRPRPRLVARQCCSSTSRRKGRA